jgi:hypothetical protein
MCHLSSHSFSLRSPLDLTDEPTKPPPLLMPFAALPSAYLIAKFCLKVMKLKVLFFLCLNLCSSHMAPLHSHTRIPTKVPRINWLVES